MPGAQPVWGFFLLSPILKLCIMVEIVKRAGEVALHCPLLVCSRAGRSPASKLSERAA
jgi:hypothetical protein